MKQITNCVCKNIYKSQWLDDVCVNCDRLSCANWVSEWV